jgi:hypothetical protein
MRHNPILKTGCGITGIHFPWIAIMGDPFNYEKS